MHRCTSCKLAHVPVRNLAGGHWCAGAASCANWCSGAARASSLQRGHPAWRLAVRSAQEKQMKNHCADGPALLAIGWPHLQVCQNLLAMCTGPQHPQGLGLATTNLFQFFWQKNGNLAMAKNGKLIACVTLCGPLASCGSHPNGPKCANGHQGGQGFTPCSPHGHFQIWQLHFQIWKVPHTH